MKLHIPHSLRRALLRCLSMSTPLAGVAAFTLSIQPTMAAPSGGTVVEGSGSAFIASGSNTTQITQFTDKAIINWNDFSIAANETVRFDHRTGSHAITLNRVTGDNISTIMGTMTANGNVFLINPNGILFGKGSKVDVGGLVASTLDMSNDAFLRGDYSFNQDMAKDLASVINEGTIQTGDDGFIYLIAANVENRASGKLVVAKRGHIGLGAGSAASISFHDSGLISFEVTGEIADQVNDENGNKTKEPGVSNAGEITVNGGHIIMTANVKRDIVTSVINNTGKVEANSLDDLFGKVTVKAKGGKVRSTRKIKAKGKSHIESDTGIELRQSELSDLTVKSTGDVLISDSLTEALSADVAGDLSLTSNNSSSLSLEDMLITGSLTINQQTGSIVSGADASIQINDASLTAQTGINIQASQFSRFSAETLTGNVVLANNSSQTDALILDRITAHQGNIDIKEAKGIVIAEALSSGTNTSNSVKLHSGDYINHDVASTEVLLIAPSLDLYAKNSVGNATYVGSGADASAALSALKTATSNLKVRTESQQGYVAIDNKRAGELKLDIEASTSHIAEESASVQISHEQGDITGSIKASSANLSIRAAGDITLTDSQLTTFGATTYTGSISLENNSKILIFNIISARQNGQDAYDALTKSLKATNETVTITQTGHVIASSNVMAGGHIQITSSGSSILSTPATDEEQLAPSTATIAGSTVGLSAAGAVGGSGFGLSVFATGLVTANSGTILNSGSKQEGGVALTL